MEKKKAEVGFFFFFFFFFCLNPPQVDLCFSNASGRPGSVRPAYNKGLYVQTVFHFMNFLVSTVILGLEQQCEAVIRV